MTAEATTATATGFRHFHDQLSSLKEQLLGMSAIAEERTELAVEALLARDREKANLVIAGDADLNQLEIEVEQAAVELAGSAAADGARPSLHHRSDQGIERPRARG